MASETPRERTRAHILKLRAIEQRRRAINDKARHAYAVARLDGLDTKALRVVVLEGFTDKVKRKKHAGKIAAYRRAVAR